MSEGTLSGGTLSEGTLSEGALFCIGYTPEWGVCVAYLEVTLLNGVSVLFIWHAFACTTHLVHRHTNSTVEIWKLLEATHLNGVLCCLHT